MCPVSKFLRPNDAVNILRRIEGVLVCPISQTVWEIGRWRQDRSYTVTTPEHLRTLWRKGTDVAVIVECSGLIPTNTFWCPYRTEKCRLVREMSAEELANFGVYITGSHSVHDGFFVATGDARIEAYGKSWGRAFGSSHVDRMGDVAFTESADIAVFDNATVSTHGKGPNRVDLYDSAKVLKSNANTKVTRAHK